MEKRLERWRNDRDGEMERDGSDDLRPRRKWKTMRTTGQLQKRILGNNQQGSTKRAQPSKDKINEQTQHEGMLES